MHNQYITQIKSIIGEIEKTNALLANFNDSEDIVDITVKSQIQRKKKNLFKELLSVLLASNLNISSYETLYQKTINFLKNDEDNMILSSDFKHDIKKAEELLF